LKNNTIKNRKNGLTNGLKDPRVTSNQIEINKKQIFKPQSRFGKIYCWTCGLSQGDAELCVKCPYQNNSHVNITT
jgi:hypothetical protein